MVGGGEAGQLVGSRCSGPYKLSVGDLNPKNFYNRINYEDGRIRFELAKDEKESLPGEIMRAAKRLARIANRNKRGLSPYDYAQVHISGRVEEEGKEGHRRRGIIGCKNHFEIRRRGGKSVDSGGAFLAPTD